MIADIMTNKKFHAIVKEIFIRCRKLNISLVFISQSYFSVPKDVRSNTTHYFNIFNMEIKNRIELKILQLIILQTQTIMIFKKITENVQKNLLIF